MAAQRANFLRISGVLRARSQRRKCPPSALATRRRGEILHMPCGLVLRLDNACCGTRGASEISDVCSIFDLQLDFPGKIIFQNERGRLYFSPF
jgi:hypothetical protein